MKWIEFLGKQSRPRLVAITLFMVIAIGLLDYWVPSEISTFVFYLIPILLAAWIIGKWAGAFVAVASAMIWFVAAAIQPGSPPDPIELLWNAIARLISFLIMAVILSALKTMSSHLERERTEARTDPLTGAANRRWFYEIVEREIQRVHRYARPFTIVYMDLDEFKQINDALGHQTGDRVLQQVGAILEKAIRDSDVVARMGGDEFVLLLPEADASAARATSQRILSNLAKVMDDKGWQVSASLGVVTFTHPLSTVDEMVRIADECMYTAKQNGKNKIEYRTV